MIKFTTDNPEIEKTFQRLMEAMLGTTTPTEVADVEQAIDQEQFPDKRWNTLKPELANTPPFKTIKNPHALNELKPRITELVKRGRPFKTADVFNGRIMNSNVRTDVITLLRSWPDVDIVKEGNALVFKPFGSYKTPAKPVATYTTKGAGTRAVGRPKKEDKG